MILDDWFPAPEDKRAVYALIQAAEPYLNHQQKERLATWKQKNPINCQRQTQNFSSDEPEIEL